MNIIILLAKEQIKAVANHYQIDMTVPLKNRSKKLNIILYGSPDPNSFNASFAFSRFYKNTTTKTPKYDFLKV
uniref:hypothetical protein n=1 Tax=Areca yellow leaf disease phytoplasma TaxID=927614 RepID=UPI004040399A